MKPIYFLIFSCICLVSLSFGSCSKPKTLRIAVSQCSDDDWRRKMNDELRREAMFHSNVELEILSANDNTQTQIDQLRKFAREDFDIIIVAPNEAEDMTPLIDSIYKAGIPVVVFDRGIRSNSFTAFQGADNYKLGRDAAEYIKSKIPNPKVIEIYGLEDCTPADDRHKGFADAVAENPGMETLATGIGNWTFAGGRHAADSLLRACPQANVVYAHNDWMAIGARHAADSLGRKNLMIVGIDAAPTIGLQAVADGKIDATFIYPTEGGHLLKTAIAILEGKPFDRMAILPALSPVDSTNAEILLNQNKMLEAETEKVYTLSSRMDEYWKQHSAQTHILYAAITILILLTIVIFLLLRAYWIHKHNKQQIELRNRELATQKDEISGLYQQLQDATQSKLTFYTNVSHDLRTPLTLIADPVARMAEASNLTPDQHMLMRLADKNVKILMRLVNQILDIRKFDNGQLKPHLTNVNFGLLLNEWASAFSLAARKSHINLCINVPSGSEMVTAVDVDKMERVVFNLISNAFKFTPANGTITITAAREADSLVIAVADTGCGIPAEQISRIFDRFFKTDHVNPLGSGIGLALTKVFVEMHSGTISVDSNPGHGTVFKIVIPIIEVQSEPTQIPHIDLAKDSSELIALEDDELEAVPEGEVVLVIDDNPDIRTLVKTILAHKYTVVQAANGADGIRKASKFIPSLIICDVMMPGIDGFETCRLLKGEVVTSHIPVLLLTACSRDEQRTMGYECGADGYLSKPFDSQMLLARCESLIENRRRISAPSPVKSNTPKAKPESKPRDIDDEFYARFMALVEAELANPDLSAEDMAARLGLSRVQMYRKLKALTNYSPTELLRISRLKRAAHLLKTTQSSVSEICYAVGFSSPSYFTKCYKEYFAEYPTDTQARTSKMA